MEICFGGVAVVFNEGDGVVAAFMATERDGYAVMLARIDSLILEALKNKNDSITQDDLALCALVLLKIPNRDVALLLGLSADALKKRKQRLKAVKLGIGEPLDDWLPPMAEGHLDMMEGSPG